MKVKFSDVVRRANTKEDRFNTDKEFYVGGEHMITGEYLITRRGTIAGSKDMAMVALMYNYGRYLLISSSQPGGQAANLQGVWNNSKNAPWDSKYTININTEMNYWPAEVTNTRMPPLHSPSYNRHRAVL